MLTDADRALLVDFLAQLKAARLPQRDPEAAQLINEALLVQPDGAQLLVLKCLLQQHALEDLRHEVEALRAQLAQRPAPVSPAPPDRGFLSRLFGAPSPSVAPAMPASPGYGGPGPGSGLLGNIASTAAGVAAGEFLFSGVEHLLHGERAVGFGGLADAGVAGGAQNVTINEYYGADAEGRHGSDDFLNVDQPLADADDDAGDGFFDA